MVKRILIKLFVVPALAAALFTSCSTDIDLLEDYKPITVVYGLLNVNDSIQYIKVNKAFLGEGNALLMAQNSDSINYRPGEITVQLQRINPSTGEVLQTIDCDTTTQILKDDGVFYSPYQILFKTTATIDEDASYRLVVNRIPDATSITAVTPIVNDVVVTNPDPLFPGAQVGFWNGSTQNYQTFTLRWKQSADAEIYSATLRFTYYDSLLVAPFTKDTITLEYNLGDVMAGNTAVGGSKEIKIFGENFFTFLDASVNDDVNKVRWAEEFLEIYLSAGAEDLHTYIEVNKPSIGLIQEKPVFTNVNNGTGIFSSRWATTLRNRMSSGTVAKANLTIN